MSEETKNQWHKHNRTRAIWYRMNRRCHHREDICYEQYGGRGIKVCDRWRLSFAAFLADMGEAPPGKSLDRIDNNGNYYPANCRWATKREQQNNRSCTVRLTYRGETKTLADWARIKGMSWKSLYSRAVTLGWDTERALSTPVQKRVARRHLLHKDLRKEEWVPDWCI